MSDTDIGRALAGQALVSDEAATHLRPSGFDPSRKPQNKCAVSHYPAGHEWACNDCDPCLLGSFPSEWCETCAGETWIGDRPCYNCDGTGFRERDSDGSGEAGQTAEQAGPKATARAEGIALPSQPSEPKGPSL